MNFLYILKCMAKLLPPIDSALTTEEARVGLIAWYICIAVYIFVKLFIRNIKKRNK